MLLRLGFAPLLAVQVPEPPAPVSAWEAPTGCPTRADLQTAIDRRLGRPLAAGEVGLTGRITVTDVAPRYHLTLHLTAGGRDETRHLAAERCGALADATALLVGLAVDEAEAAALPAPQREHGTSATADPALPAGVREQDTRAAGDSTEAPAIAGPAITGPPATPDAATPVEPAAPAATPRETIAPAPAPRLGGLLRIHGGAELGALPAITGAVGFAGALLWRRARLEFHGNYLAPRTEVRPQGSLRAFMASGAVLGCGRLGRGRVEVPLCGGLEFGAMHGTARRVSAPREATGLWLAAVGSVGAAVRVHPRWSVVVALETAVRIRWPRFELRDPGPAVRLFEPAPLSGRLLVGVEVRIADPW